MTIQFRNVNAAIMAVTETDLGLKEWPGAKSNPAVEEFWEEAGMRRQTDDVAWCAAYVGAKLAELGLPNTGKPNARSYLNWGTEVPLSQAMPGDVVVYWRGSRSGWQGHVGFFVEISGGNIVTRGGNQSNSVSDTLYAVDRLLSVRRWTGGTPLDIGPPTLKLDDTGTFVKALQEGLRDKGHFLGRVDGHFGPITRAAVLAFQADNGLTTDGIVGPQTWAALSDKAAKRPERNASRDDLSESRTMQTASHGKRAAEGFTIAGAGTWVLGNLDTLSPKLAAADGVLANLKTLVEAYGPILLMIAAGALVWFLLNRIQGFRLQDAITGKHLGR